MTKTDCTVTTLSLSLRSNPLMLLHEFQAHAYPWPATTHLSCIEETLLGSRPPSKQLLNCPQLGRGQAHLQQDASSIQHLSNFPWPLVCVTGTPKADTPQRSTSPTCWSAAVLDTLGFTRKPSLANSLCAKCCRWESGLEWLAGASWPFRGMHWNGHGQGWLACVRAAGSTHNALGATWT